MNNASGPNRYHLGVRITGAKRMKHDRYPLLEEAVGLIARLRGETVNEVCDFAEDVTRASINRPKRIAIQSCTQDIYQDVVERLPRNWVVGYVIHAPHKLMSGRRYLYVIASPAGSWVYMDARTNLSAGTVRQVLARAGKEHRERISGMLFGRGMMVKAKAAKPRRIESRPGQRAAGPVHKQRRVLGQKKIARRPMAVTQLSLPRIELVSSSVTAGVKRAVRAGRRRSSDLVLGAMLTSVATFGFADPPKSNFPPVPTSAMASTQMASGVEMLPVVKANSETQLPIGTVQSGALKQAMDGSMGAGNLPTSFVTQAGPAAPVASERNQPAAPARNMAPAKQPSAVHAVDVASKPSAAALGLPSVPKGAATAGLGSVALKNIAAKQPDAPAVIHRSAAPMHADIVPGTKYLVVYFAGAGTPASSLRRYLRAYGISYAEPVATVSGKKAVVIQEFPSLVQAFHLATSIGSKTGNQPSVVRRTS